MAQATLNHTPKTQSPFRTHLTLRQPEVLIWLEQHLQGRAQDTGIELASRYFEIGERWTKTTPSLSQFELNQALVNQVPTIDPKNRWMTEIPVPLPVSDRISLGRILRALVAASVTPTGRHESECGRP